MTYVHLLMRWTYVQRDTTGFPEVVDRPLTIDEHASTDASDGSDIACDAVSVGGLSDTTAVERPDTKSDLGGRIDDLLTAIRRLPENAEGSWDTLCVRLEDTAKRLAVPTPSAADVEAFNELLGDIWAETDDLLRAKTPPNYTKWLHMGSLFGVCLTTVAAANAACARSESASEAEIRISEIAYCVPAALMILLKALGSYIDQRHIEHPHDTVKHLRQAFHLVNSAFVVSRSAPVDGGSEATPDAQPGCASGSELAWERVPYPSEWALSQQRVELNGEHALPQLSIELMDRVTAAWQLIIPKTLAGDEIEAQVQRVLMSDLLIALSVFSMRANDGADEPSDARQSAFDAVAQAISDIQRHSKGFASWEQKTFRISRLVKLLDVIRLSSVPVLLVARTYFRSPNPQPTETPSDELKGFYYFFRDIGIPIIAVVTAANFLLTTKHGNRTAELLRKMDVVSKRWLKQYRPTSTDHPGFRVAETPVNNLRRRSLP